MYISATRPVLEYAFSIVFVKMALLLATCLCLNGSLLDKLCCIYYFQMLYAYKLKKIIFLSVCPFERSWKNDISPIGFIS